MSEPIKLTGNFGYHQAVMAACEAVETLQKERDGHPYGSSKWYVANAELSQARLEYDEALRRGGK